MIELVASLSTTFSVQIEDKNLTDKQSPFLTNVLWIFIGRKGVDQEPCPEHLQRVGGRGRRRRVPQPGADALPTHPQHPGGHPSGPLYPNTKVHLPAARGLATGAALIPHSRQRRREHGGEGWGRLPTLKQTLDEIQLVSRYQRGLLNHGSHGLQEPATSFKLFLNKL